MPVSSSSILRYLARPYQDYRWLKALDDKEIDSILQPLNPNFNISLRRHQKIGFLLGIAHFGWYFQYDMGTGKSLVSLEIINYLYRLKQITKVVILVPTNELILNWADEIQKWNFKIPFIELEGASDSKWEEYSKISDGIVLLSYPGLVHMVTCKGVLNNKNKLSLDQDAIIRFCTGIDCVVFDESTRLGNKDTLSFRVCNQIATRTKFKYALAGKLFGRDPSIAWSQFYLIDKGETLGFSFNFFREVFFNKYKSYFGGPYSYEYKFNKKRADDFNRICANVSLRFSAAECLDLPRVIYTRKLFSLPTATMLFYQTATQSLKASRGNFREVKNTFLRMRQISSGFIGLVDDENDERTQIEFPSNPKLDLLLELIEEMPEDSKFIICVEFTRSGAMISEALRKIKINHGWLYSQTKDWESMKNKFDNEDNFKGLIVQSKKGGLGLNLQRANFCMFYESPISVLDRQQFEARINRQGQEKTIFIYDLICKGTADESILNFHSEGRSLFKVLMTNPDEVLI